MKYDLSIHQNPDAKVWTDLFFETHPHCNIEYDIMLTWFANAMMAMHDHLILKGAPINGDHAQWKIDNERRT